jgi:hypothetical protein
VEGDDDLSNCGRAKVDDDEDGRRILGGGCGRKWSVRGQSTTTEIKKTWDMVGRKGRNIPKSQGKKRISLRK